MPRAAGTSHVYQWKLMGARRGTEPTISFPSVTHMQHTVKDAFGFGGMAWWGYRVGIEDFALQNKMVKNDPVALLDLYEDTKTDSDHTPNTVRDEAGDRGKEGHDILEKLGLGTLDIFQDDDDKLFVVDVDGDKDPFYLEAWNLAAGRWWLAQDMAEGSFVPERSVWSLRYGYQGTLDLHREVNGKTIHIAPHAVNVAAVEGGLEIVDYKSHKPAQGMRKDGSYAEGKGPAYIDDLIQLQGYAECVEGMGLGDVVGTRVVLLGADGNYLEDTRTVPYETFLHVKSLHDLICRKPECMLLAQAYGRGRE